MNLVIFKIDGMHCSMCEAHVNNLVIKINNRYLVKANHLKKIVSVASKEKINISEIKASLENNGYLVLAITKGLAKKTLFSFKQIA